MSFKTGVFSAARARRRRSVHFVPGNSERFLSRCLAAGADTLILDLEDSVSAHLKDEARARVAAWLAETRRAQAQRDVEILVRINPLDLQLSDAHMWERDLEATVAHADGFVVPKASTASDITRVADKLASLEREHGITTPRIILPVATETAEAVLNLQEIARAHERVVAITWGCEDLSAELGATGSRNPKTGEYLDVFKHARLQTLLAAKAAGICAVDGVYADVRDRSGCMDEAQEALYMGFDGKLTLHPDQISAVHEAFRPGEAELAEARAIVALFAREEKAGAAAKGALTYKGRMVDLPHLKRAEKLLGRRRTPDDGACERAAKPAQSNVKCAEVAVVPFVRAFHGKYLEEMRVGDVIHHALTRTVTETDNVLFTCLSLNPAPLHLDHELAKDTEFGRPLFNSMFTMALLVGMSVLETTHGTTIANLGFSEVKFPKPVFCGDTMRAETQILASRPSKSRPNQGIVKMEHRMMNQKGELVCKCVRQALMKKKPLPAAKL